MFEFWFNCAFFDGNGVMLLDKNMLDTACKVISIIAILLFTHSFHRIKTIRNLANLSILKYMRLSLNKMKNQKLCKRVMSQSIKLKSLSKSRENLLNKIMRIKADRTILDSLSVRVEDALSSICSFIQARLINHFFFSLSLFSLPLF